MDFCIFGCLKRALGKRHLRTIEGLWKVVKEEWDLLSMTMIRKCLLSWKIRTFTSSSIPVSSLDLPTAFHPQFSGNSKSKAINYRLRLICEDRLVLEVPRLPSLVRFHKREVF
ncbi:hypothetical protein LAZ67_3000003 [Cordylochernes scorpioides]|uniref:Uncharacterized protein n=1 Tax=Cordylochernes scorpioides TaxID=51811 RepID=A0ABY6K5X3_9ARAC|nr:hypothetical protein LAZ67_3000003 [Cordylochernes scorpioides]